MQFDQIKRREFITLLGGAAVAWPLSARAQQPRMPIVGFLNSASLEGYAPLVAAFRHGLKETGFVEGQNLTIEYRWAEGLYGRLPTLAADLAERKVDVIAATSTPAALAAKAATSTVPIVFTTGGDPVKLGLVASLNRPGGNVTGVSSMLSEIASKRLGLLREFVPATTIIANLVNPGFQGTEGQLADMEAAARGIGLQLIVLRASSEGEIDAAFALVQRGGGALIVAADPFLLSRRNQIIELAARGAIPVLYPARDYALAGGLMSYGTDLTDSYRQCGIYAGRIIKGEKPADLPVQRSTKFEFVINLKAAKALNRPVPNSMQLLADEVIE
jgi:putative tryptophan/tyrosine transport system substrate-binding protein